MTLSLRTRLLTLPQLKIIYNEQEVLITDAIIDTGSMATLLDADIVATINVTPDTGGQIRTVTGIGGEEHVYEHEVTLELGNTKVTRFIAQIGEIQQYGTPALIGLDFLLATNAKLDMEALTLAIST